MDKTELAERDVHSFVSDDKSDTVMTGFNTDDPLDDWEQLMDEKQLDEEVQSTKSVGKEVKIPFARDEIDPDEELEQIIELSENNEDAMLEEPDSPEK